MRPNFQPTAEALEPAFNEANCKQLGIEALHIMYPTEGDEVAEAIAKSVCTNCVAIVACQERGNYEPAGVWAGQTAHERDLSRRKIRREQRRHRGNSS